MDERNYKVRFYGDSSGKFSNGDLSFLENNKVAIILNENTNEVLSLSDFEIELGGHNEDRIKLVDATRGVSIVSEDHQLISALQNCGENKIANQAKEVELKLYRVSSEKKTYWWKTLGIVGVFFLAFYFSADWLCTTLITSMDPHTESSFGRLLSTNVRKDPSGPDLERLNRIGQRLVSHLKNNPYSFEFIVASDDHINAFAYPGGIIVVNRGLLQRATDDSEIAGVLAHEIGHVIHRDTLKKWGHQMGLWTVVQVCLGLTSPEHADEIAQTLSTAKDMDSLRYSRAQEHDADMASVQLALDSDYRPDAMIAFFERLQKDPSSSDNKALGLLSTHPLNEERIASVKAEARRLEKLALRKRHSH